MGCSSSAEKINTAEIDVSHFEVETVIGQGGFGKVQCVSRKQEPSRLFAMKTMNKADTMHSKSGIAQVGC